MAHHPCLCSLPFFLQLRTAFFDIFSMTLITLFRTNVSLFVSKSVSAPLKEMEMAMKEVEKGNLDVHIRVVSNDEIGALGEGFGRMIKGLKESEAIKESFGKYIP